MGIKRATWREFRDAGWIWWCSRMLHLFGWCLVYVEDEKTGEITEVYPARCDFRGFSEEIDDEGFRRVTRDLAQSMPQLLANTAEPEPGKDEGVTES